MLTDAQLEGFVSDGFVRVDGAFSAATAAAARDILWRATGCDPEDAATWTQPVIRLPGFADEPFRTAARSPLLARACDQLVGSGRWVPRGGLGTFPMRFPSDQPPGDDGWHIDASFAGDDPNDYLRWRVNVASKGRGLLMLFLCHPFLVHAAQAHRGRNPKFMAQPPLELREELELDRPGGYHVPVEAAIRRGLAR